ncbi:hypothetical protein EVAR_48164_1 [Eumeta japonica]|uniref:Uncharacterized protein n=1 Tax=Eumeta variegata TaxID=151549 RepID=A0A4C1WS79_EUMVA|nr:hypothetical protein EVAR_48164_1 [Eumeta japonica]
MDGAGKIAAIKKELIKKKLEIKRTDIVNDNNSQIATSEDENDEINTASVEKWLLTYSTDFGTAYLDPSELRTVVQYTYTLSERLAELHGRQSGDFLIRSLRSKLTIKAMQ